jgi:hypothetical protein
MITDTTPADGPSEGGETSAPAKPVELRPQPSAKPKRPLPTPRISFQKQMDILRAWGVASSSERPVPLAAVEEIAHVSANTLTLANAFYIDAGFLIKSESGLLGATTVVQDFAQTYQWTPDTAATKLAPALRKHWAWLTLEPRLRFGALTERDAIAALAEAAGASPEYRPQLSLVLEYLKTVALVEFDGLNYRVATAPAVDATGGDSKPPAPEDKPAAPASPRPTGGASAGFPQQPGGQLNFGVSVRVDMAEMSTWTPERIAAFFSGIAQVLAAKGKVESGLTETDS